MSQGAVSEGTRRITSVSLHVPREVSTVIVTTF